MENMPKYKDVISLIPYGLPQFLDFEVPMSVVRKVSLTVMEELESSAANDDGTLIKNVRLYELEQDEEGEFVIPETKTPVDETEYCTITSDKHIDVWLDQWIPVPFFRHSDDRHPDGKPVFQYGPINWARAYLTRTRNEIDTEPANWRLVLAFDMQVDPSDERHISLTTQDVSDSAICSLAAKKRDNAQFLMENWVNEWLKSLWAAYFEDQSHLRQNMPRRAVQDSETETGELHLAHLASYLVYLGVLDKIIGNKSVRIVKLEEDSSESNVINVDLVLDIGNSRSTGILVEHLPDDSCESTLLNSYRLTLRDMSRPYLMYGEPFETRVEFSKTETGLSEYSDRSERENAFAWASPVRTGPEATRLSGLSVNAEGASGMSSPKRYLWDLEERDLWFFNKSQSKETEELVSSLTLCRYVNNCGIPLENLKEIKAANQPVPEGGERISISSIALDFQNIFGKELKDQLARFAMQPRFARSSLMMFLFMELIQQALITINTPAIRDSRGFPDRPRRLSTLIFTVPPGMPAVEKTIYSAWGKAAVEVMWNVFGWKKFYQDHAKKRKKKEVKKPICDFRANPSVQCLWDEATCTQLVYVYNEIKHNYAYDAQLFFENMGKERLVPIDGGEAHERETRYSLRVATIDIGGGTTDISITTFIQANDASSTTRIWPKQEITDGFHVGGDDVLRNIVTSLVLKGIAQALAKKNIPQRRAEEALRHMFGQKSIDVRVQNQRVQFVRQIAMPVAYAILSLYEERDLHDVSGEFSFTLRSVYSAKPIEAPSPDVCAFFSQEIERRFGLTDFDIMDVEFSIPCSEVDKAITSVMSPALSSMGELVHAYDCDILLLTGRPSCWNAIVRQIFSMMAIAPDRVVPMRNYRVGSWYRFADESGTITDPKTTVVMGAVLCQLAENALEGFVFNSSRLKLKDTARFIGELDNQGVLQADKVWFDISTQTNSKKAQGEGLEKIVEFSAPISIGFRQLGADRWTAIKCWFMDFANDEARKRSVGKTPYKVRVEFKIPEVGEQTVDDKALFKEKLNQPSINYVDYPDSVKERDGENVVTGRPIVIKLSTLSKADERGCWMDTGVLYN
ncbi:MAG: virulence factor SrfB [Desulfovibrionaceae bacterium]|nr:virulence factor SrfB [Desulfovibrionaceae bacterium]